MSDVTPRKLTLLQKLAYASGQAGNVLLLQLVGAFAVNHYQPPEGHGTPLLPVLGGFAVTIMMMTGRLVDTPFDPLIANISDRSPSRLGRRRKFMLIACAPLALFTALVFFPPAAGASVLNLVWAAVMLSIHYCLFSTYVAPYLALLPEIAPDIDERTRLSAMLGAATLVGGAIATIVGPALFLGAEADAAANVRTMVAALCFVAFVLMLLPLTINEWDFVSRKPGEAASHLGFVASLKETFREPAFIPYVFGMNLFFFAFTIVQTAAPYYVQVLLQRPLRDQGLVAGPLFGASAVAFVIIAIAAKRVGKRPLMIGGSLALAALLAVGIPLLPAEPEGAPVVALVFFAVCGLAIATWLALPNAMISDICEANAKKTGQRREAVFFGAQGFIQKVMLGVAGSLVAVLAAQLGSSTEHPLGVRATGPVAAVALVLAAWCFYKYPEAQVQREMKGS